MSAALLDVRALKAAYGPIMALHGIDLTLHAGQVMAVLGANGAGKTTLLRALTGGVGVSGEIRLDGQRIDGQPTERIARKGLALVPDGRGTFVEMSVEENLALGAYMRRDRQGIAADTETVYGWFPRLRERRRQQAGSLSGGEQQMLAIGRALMSRPRLLLLDEPSFGLAPLIVQEIYRILHQIRDNAGVTMIVVEQHAGFALDLAAHAIVLELGRITAAGPVAALRDDPRIADAYLGH